MVVVAALRGGGEPAGEADATPFMAEDPSGRDLWACGGDASGA